MVGDVRFPRQVCLSGSWSVAWVESEVEDWMQAWIEASRSTK